MEVKTNTESINVNKDHIESITTDISDVKNKLNNQATRITNDIEKKVDAKLQITIIEAVGSQ